MKTVKLKLILITGLLFVSFLASSETLVVGEFSKSLLQGWKEKEFAQQTKYQIVSQQGVKVLKAQSYMSASGLYKEQRVDLQKTPYLNWSWRVENRLGNLNEQTKEGDDYVARIYVLVSGGVAFWNTRALNYVWAGNSPKESVWENAFVGKNAIMIAARSKKDNLKQWYNEKRNILNDLKKYFDEDIYYIDAVAIMTDTDNSASNATAFYGDIYFTTQ